MLTHCPTCYSHTAQAFSLLAQAKSFVVVLRRPAELLLSSSSIKCTRSVIYARCVEARRWPDAWSEYHTRCPARPNKTATSRVPDPICRLPGRSMPDPPPSPACRATTAKYGNSRRSPDSCPEACTLIWRQCGLYNARPSPEDGDTKQTSNG